MRLVPAGYERSQVELYRAGKIKRIGEVEGRELDPRDPFDRAIVTALQLYVDALERDAWTMAAEIEEAEHDPEKAAALRRLSFQPDWRKRTIYEGSRESSRDTMEFRFRSPLELEFALLDLRDAVRDGKMAPDERGMLHDTVQLLLEALSQPSEVERNAAYRRGKYLEYESFPRAIWSEEAGEEVSRQPDVPVKPESQLEPLGVLMRGGIEIAQGDLMTQAEAARALGITSESVRRRRERGTLPSVKVGARVLIPVEAVERARREKEEKEAPEA